MGDSITPRVFYDNETRTAPTFVFRSDGFHRKLRTEVEKERGSGIEQGNCRGWVKITQANDEVGPAKLQVPWTHLQTLSRIIPHNTGERNVQLFLSSCRTSFPATQERKHAARRTACSLPLAPHFPHQRTENVWFEEPLILCLSHTVPARWVKDSRPVVYHLPRTRRENMKFLELHVPKEYKY
jgi:hypothetical protein